jgi:hypothetical protein
MDRDVLTVEGYLAAAARVGFTLADVRANPDLLPGLITLAQ